VLVKQENLEGRGKKSAGAGGLPFCRCQKAGWRFKPGQYSCGFFFMKKKGGDGCTGVAGPEPGGTSYWGLRTRT